MNAAREKVEAEAACRACGDGDVEHLDAAHVWDRSLGGPGFDDPDAVIPLCSAIKGGAGCHDDYDDHRLDVLGLLTTDESVALVRYAGSIARAFRRASGDGLAVDPDGPDPDDLPF